uniref:Uncharacterized protein n=1 Tax=Tetranychus urticae TaxID=32264 RepID=T1KIL3_TETUR
MSDDRRKSRRSFKASKDIINQARKTSELTNDLAKMITKPKPKKVSAQAKETAAVTVEKEKEVREKLKKK